MKRSAPVVAGTKFTVRGFHRPGDTPRAARIGACALADGGQAAAQNDRCDAEVVPGCLRRPATGRTEPQRAQPLLTTPPPHPALADGMAGGLKLVGEEPVAELGVVRV
jgi:hypothetical protein